MLNQLLLVIAGAAVFLAAMRFARSIHRDFILCLPLIHVLGDLTVGIGFAGVHGGHVRAAVVASLFVLVVPRLRYSRSNIILLALLLYFLVLALLTSNPGPVLILYSKFALSLLAFPIAAHHIRTIDHLRWLGRFTAAATIVVSLHYLFAQLYRVGPNPYRADLLYTGDGTIQLTFVLAISLVVAPLVIRILPGGQAIVYGAVSALAALPMILVGRRGAIVAAAAGIAAYVLTVPRRTAQMKAFAVILLVLVATHITAGERVVQAIDARSDAIVRDMEGRGARASEIKLALSSVVEQSTRHALFGTELFNYHRYAGINRPFHTDYAAILFGSGLLGASLYLLLFVSITRDVFRFTTLIADRPLAGHIRATHLALLTAMVFLSYSGLYYVMTALSLVFLYFGAIVGVSRTLARQSCPEGRAIRRTGSVITSQ